MTPKIVTARFLRYFLAAKSGKKIYIIIRKVINTKVEMWNDLIYKIYSETKSHKKNWCVMEKSSHTFLFIHITLLGRSVLFKKLYNKSDF